MTSLSDTEPDHDADEKRERRRFKGGRKKNKKKIFKVF